MGTESKCKEMDKKYDGRGGRQGSQVWQDLRKEVLPDATMEGPKGKGGQKHLSGLIDAKLREGLEGGPGADQAYKLHLYWARQPGAGAWLTAPPADDGRAMAPDLFRTAVARRLRLKIMHEEDWCPCCAEIMDIYGDHALVCACKGDRTVRHNKVRNIVWEETQKAGMETVKEKANLLPARPGDDGIRAEGARRPADIWWKGGDRGRGEAWDFAVTSGLRGDRMRKGEDGARAVFADYEDFKKGYKDTNQQCEAQGIKFQPLILEAHGGGFSPALRDRLETVARRQRAVWSEGHEDAGLVIAQRISICLQAENARAIIRRLRTPEGGTRGSEEQDWGGTGKERKRRLKRRRRRTTPRREVGR
jgi:hypothetical protein